MQIQSIWRSPILSLAVALLCAPIIKPAHARSRVNYPHTPPKTIGFLCDIDAKNRARFDCLARGLARLKEASAYPHLATAIIVGVRPLGVAAARFHLKILSQSGTRIINIAPDGEIHVPDDPELMAENPFVVSDREGDWPLRLQLRIEGKFEDRSSTSFAELEQMASEYNAFSKSLAGWWSWFAPQAHSIMVDCGYKCKANTMDDNASAMIADDFHNLRFYVGGEPKPDTRIHFSHEPYEIWFRDWL